MSRDRDLYLKEFERAKAYGRMINRADAENERLKKDVADFNRGWQAAKDGEPIGDRMDSERHGWIVFSYTDIKAENMRLRAFLLAWDGHYSTCGVNREEFEWHDEAMFICDCGYEQAKTKAFKEKT